MTTTPQVAEIKSAQRRAWQEEWPFTIELLPLGWLFADDRYQRPRVDPFVEKMALTFDATLVGTIDVSMRKGDEYAILDGYQRTEAMRVVDKKAAWCTVYRDMRLRDEADFFIKKNRERRNMHPYYALRARRVSGDQSAERIFEITEQHGYRLGSSSIADNMIVAIAAVEEVYAMTSLRRPDESLTPALRTIRDAFGDREGAVKGTVIRGLGRVWQAFGDDEIDPVHLVDVLGQHGPAKLLGYATDRVGTSRFSKAYLVAQEVIKLYNKAMPRGRKLEEQFLDASKRDRPGRSRVDAGTGQHAHTVRRTAGQR